MAKCNELGICESKASRKAEKAVERIKLLKVSICPFNYYFIGLCNSNT